MSKVIRGFREREDLKNIQFFRNFSPVMYAALLNNCKCIMGNSSSGIRESAFLGVPCVNIGNRQKGRERGPNIVDVPNNATQIVNAVKKQINKGRFPSSNLFGDGEAGKKIANILEKCDVSLIKKLNYLNK